MEPNEQAIIASSSIFPAINSRSSIETISDRGAHCQNLENTMNVMDSQLYPAYKSLAALRQRILNTDAVGLGKRLECGILVSECCGIDFGNPSNFLDLTSHH